MCNWPILLVIILMLLPGSPAAEECPSPQLVLTSTMPTLEDTVDPTGAGDTFAGGFMGYLANSHNFQESGIRKAIIFGSVMASFTVERFSIDRLRSLTFQEIEDRYREFKRLTLFEES